MDAARNRIARRIAAGAARRLKGSRVVLLSGVVDTLIVLGAVYAGLALACSFVNEACASVLKWRGTMLFAGIVKLLGGSVALVETIYQHPFIASGCGTPNRKALPSYIEARNFSLALWQTVRGGETAATDAVADLQRCVTAIDPGGSSPLVPVPGTLASLLAHAATDYESLLRATDVWFDRQMDRVSGWYRRRTQCMLLVLGAFVAFGFGVDSLHIVTRLYSDAKIRTIVAERIDAAYAAEPKTVPAGTRDSGAAFADRLDRSLEDSAVPVDAFIDTNLRHFFWKRLTRVDAFVGATITTLAIALGAPFWFDVLGGLVNVRLAGVRPGKTTAAPAPAPMPIPEPVAAPAGIADLLARTSLAR